MKFKRAPCSLGWTDHSFHRMRDKILDGTAFKNKLIFGKRKKRRRISDFNEKLNREPLFPF